MQVDYVIPFVDSSDSEWVGAYRKYVPANCSWSSNATRFRDWDTLRYQLRSISRHLPWIRTVALCTLGKRIAKGLHYEGVPICVLGAPSS